MSVEKMSVSFDLDVGSAIKNSAHRSGTSVSRWLADAAAARLRNEALAGALDAWERKYGSLTEKEVARVEADLRKPSGRTLSKTRK